MSLLPPHWKQSQPLDSQGKPEKLNFRTLFQICFNLSKLHQILFSKILWGNPKIAPNILKPLISQSDFINIWQVFIVFFSGAFFSFSTALVALRLKPLPPMQETWVRSLGPEDPLEKEMATHSSILAWRIPWTEEPGGLQSTGLQRVGHDWATSLSFPFLSPLFYQQWSILLVLNIFSAASTFSAFNPTLKY